MLFVICGMIYLALKQRPYGFPLRPPAKVGKGSVSEAIGLDKNRTRRSD